MSRKTYIDNNGFLRYEDTCKIVPNQPDNKLALNEMYNIFGNSSKNQPELSIDEMNYLEGRCIKDFN